MSKEKNMACFKASKHLPALLLVGKAAGAARRPRDLQNIARASLFVVYDPEWLTPFSKIGFPSLFNQAKQWCNKNTCHSFMLLLVIMSLLILCWMIIYCANIRVVYLYPNTTPLLKPMDESVIGTFRGYYL
jgi:hypothetical protein